jgi:Mrp family chromosome partitioning ATPase
MTAIPLRQLLDAPRPSVENTAKRFDPDGAAPLRIDDMIGLLRAVARACPARSSRIIQLISCDHREGVSAIARAMAYTASAIDGARTLVCDATANQDTLHMFGKPADLRGLSDLVGRQGDIASTIARIPSMNYAVCMLTGASDGGHPAVRSGRLGAVMDLLRGAFDWIIIDSPPISDGAFGATLSELCDGSILVAQGGRARTSLLEQGQRMIDLYGGRVLGVVLNKVDAKAVVNGRSRR